MNVTWLDFTISTGIVAIVAMLLRPESKCPPCDIPLASYKKPAGNYFRYRCPKCLWTPESK